MRRTAHHREIPPPLELECLRALWVLGEANVKGVREIVTRRRNLAYTTVMTVLDRLARRGSVARRRSGRSFVYAPVVSREALQRLAVQDLADGLFDGSREQLIAFVQSTDWSRPAVPAPISVPEPAATAPPQAMAAAVGSFTAVAPIEEAAAVSAAPVESADVTPVPAETGPEPADSPSEDYLDAALL